MTGAPLLQRLALPARKVAVLRASRVGDFICAGPALRALRAALPEAKIAMITLPALRELVVRSPYIDQFVAFPGFPGIAQQLFSPHAALAFFQRMQAERFDLAIQMQGSGVYANPVTAMLGAAAAAGFVRPEDDPSLLDTAVVWPERGHEVQRLLALVRAVGVPATDDTLLFPLLEEDRRHAALLLEQLPRPLLGLHAGSHDPRRRWPLERFAAVACELRRRFGGTVVILGSMADGEPALELTAQIGAGAYSLAGRTTLAMLGAVIAELALLVTNDSGPAHIGYALRVPTVAIYRHGGTERYGPPAHGPFAGLEPEITGNADPQSAIVSVEQVLAGIERAIAAHSHEKGHGSWTRDYASRPSAR